MKVLLISYQYGETDAGGAAIAATRLHKALIQNGVQSYFLCIRKLDDGTNVIQLPLENRFAAFIFRHPKVQAIWSLLDLPMPGFGRLIDDIGPDVVHVHWINIGGPSLGQLSKLRGKIVIALHDQWFFNAIKPWVWNDERYLSGFNLKNASLFEWFRFKIKSRFVRRAMPFVVGPSKWICDTYRSSAIGKNCEAVLVPNLIDHAYSRTGESYSGNNGKFRMIFGCKNGRRNMAKGFDDLSAALELLPPDVKEKIELVIFGEQADACLISGVETRFLGVITSSYRLNEEYNAADICVLPSRTDNAPSVKFESLQCGLPVITFDRCGCPESIMHGVSGWVARDAAHYAEGILYFFNRWKSGALADARRSIAEENSQNNAKAIDLMMKVYEKVKECKI